MVHHSLENESDGGASGVNVFDYSKQNEAIFKNMTFDNQGNPLNVTSPDPDKINHN